MTQDVRLATVMDRLIQARQSLNLATMLLDAARPPTAKEVADLEDLLRQITTQCHKVVQYLEAGPDA
jgi:hypothetical protein